VLDASISTDDHGIVSYSWSSSDPKRPVKTTVVITRYAGQGFLSTFQDTLTVTDAQGLTSSITKTIVIP
jgi:hypothetical protein